MTMYPADSSFASPTPGAPTATTPVSGYHATRLVCVCVCETNLADKFALTARDCLQPFKMAHAVFLIKDRVIVQTLFARHYSNVNS